VRRLNLFFHDNCFDGASSAAVFAAYYRHAVDPAAQITLVGVQHKQGDPFAGHPFDGDDNVVVDFRYTDSPGLTWWFDHHVSAFQPPELRAHFEADTSGHKFYDPAARSCTKFLADVLADRFGYRSPSPAIFAELVHWADIIDGAQFPDARTAVELAEPALRLMTWIEHNHDPALTHELIGELGARPLADIAANDWITRPLEPVLERHRRNIALIRDRAVLTDGVVYFDLLDDGVDAHNKFIAYMLFPQARYTIGLTRSRARTKVSVGSNPWSPVPRTHDIAAICERYGGGGHPVVGAISFPPDAADRARQVAAEIRDELAS
jgi:hypothetical protein